MYEKRVHDETKRQTNSLEILSKQNEAKAPVSIASREGIGDIEMPIKQTELHCARDKYTRYTRCDLNLLYSYTLERIREMFVFVGCWSFTSPEVEKITCRSVRCHFAPWRQKKLNLAQHTDSPTR